MFLYFKYRNENINAFSVLWWPQRDPPKNVPQLPSKLTPRCPGRPWIRPNMRGVWVIAGQKKTCPSDRCCQICQTDYMFATNFSKVGHQCWRTLQGQDPPRHALRVHQKICAEEEKKTALALGLGHFFSQSSPVHAIPYKCLMVNWVKGFFLRQTYSLWCNMLKTRRLYLYNIYYYMLWIVRHWMMYVVHPMCTHMLSIVDILCQQNLGYQMTNDSKTWRLKDMGGSFIRLTCYLFDYCQYSSCIRWLKALC